MLRVAEHYAITDTGLQRRANEDSMLARSPLFVVADGMGGAQAGEVASRIAVETFGEDGQDFSDPEQTLAAYTHAANARIHELSHSDAAHAGMGTTLSAIYVGEQDVTIAHVGDSRVYCLRDEELLRLTDDHSLVDELIRQGRLTPEEAEEHPQRSIITRALGPEASVEVDTRSFKARAGDIYLLCSDGLTSMVGEPRMSELMSQHDRLTEMGKALIAEANREGGRDNITVVLARLEEVDLSDSPYEPEHQTVVGMPAAEPADGDAPPPQDSAPLQPQTAAGAALAQAPARPIVHRRLPRAAAPRAGERPRRGRRIRRAVVSLSLLTVLGVILAAAYLASQTVFFLGTDSNGLVTVYQGVPYQLPLGIDLYTVDYVSGVSASTITSQRRHTLLNHALRTEANVSALIHQLELGQISGG
ncbi:MAG: Stp1/IreP family PP2C-type Ser/Thr phosphatase [Solirubrobacteraceae bacterium]